MSEHRARRLAIREFSIGIVLITSLVVIVGVAYATSAASPFIDEPARSMVLLLLAGAWLGAAFSLVRSLRRDLTIATLVEEGIRVGKRTIPYDRIKSIDQQQDKPIFRVELKSGKRLLLSKVGVSSEEAFFAELRRRVGGRS